MTTDTQIHPANRLGLDYETEAGKLRRHAFPIIDFHSHLGGENSVRVYQRAANR